MILNKSLSEFTLFDFKLSPDSFDYSFDFDDTSTVAKVIFDYLVSKPGFIRHKRSVEFSRKQRNTYLAALHKIVSKGAPIEIFISAFSPKINNPSFTNNLIYPDMADFLTLLHLHMIAKNIREVYDYGFRFVIGYKGRVQKDFFGWSDEDINKTLSHLILLKESVEKIVGIRNVIEFVDIMDLAEKEGDYLWKNISKEFNSIKTEHEQGDNLDLNRKVDAWIKDFSKAIDPMRFNTKEDMDNFLLDHSYLHFAFKSKAYVGGEFDLGITNSYPNCLLATVRGLGKQLSFQLNPHFRFHSHQRLILLHEDNTWETFKWSDYNPEDLIPVYVNDFDYPFYFMKKS